MQRRIKPCKICKGEMLVGIGQEAFYHKQCRKERHNKKKGK